MHQNKVVKVFKTLSKDEIKLLTKFVQSPIHNRHKDVIQLFQYLKKHHGGKERAYDKQNIYKAVFPNEAFDMQRLHYVCSYLLKVIEEFLAWNEWKKDNTEGIYLARAYYKHQLGKSFQKSIQKVNSENEKQPLRDVKFHRRKYQIQLEEYDYSMKLGRSRHFNLQEMADSQDIAFISEKLKNACILLSHEAVTKTKYDTGLLNQVLDFLEYHSFLNVPAIAIYYHSFLALSNHEDEKPFQKLKELVALHESKFPKEEQISFYRILINYCIRRLNLGYSNFYKEIFEIYKKGLEVDVFLEHGIFHPASFGNIVMTGLRLKEFDWTEQFLFKYKNTLPEEQKEGIFNYNLARFHYQKKDYNQAMPLLSRMDSDDVLTNCSAKTLLAKMYFEQESYDALESLLNSFKIYIRRKKKELSYHLELYEHFILYSKQLWSLAVQNQKDSGNLFKKIQTTKIVAEKRWLLEQVERQFKD